LLRRGGLEYDVVLDALFGTGLDRELDASYADLIGALNESGLPVVAVDIPSGLCANTGRVLGTAVLADATVTLGAAKPGLFLGSGPNHAGRIAIVDIGLRDPEEAGIEPVGCVLDDECCEAWVPHRHPMTHKGELGHVLIVGGSAGKTGAVLLAARAALRSGAGLVTMAVPAAVAATTDAALLEAMTTELVDDGHGQVARPAWDAFAGTLERYRAVVVGPGLGNGQGVWPLVEGLVTTFRGPLVIDADGLNALAAHRSDALERAFRMRRDAGAAAAVLTPHPGEMARLLGLSSAEVQEDRLAACRDLAARLQATVVLKGAASLVSDGERTGFNSSGNAGMASPGMGDVLSGLAGTLTAEIGDPFAAASLAVYVHGLAGDILSDRYGGPGFLAGDLAEVLPAAFAALRSGTT
jgi:NAD(P)H-hydrate epimerase